MIGGVFKQSTFNAPAPAVLIHAPWLVLFYRYWNVMLTCILDLPVTGQVQFTDGCNNLKTGSTDNDIKPELVVTFTRATMTDRLSAFLAGNLHNLFCNEGAGKGGAHRVTLVGSIRPDGRKDMFIYKFLPGIDGIMTISKFFPFFCSGLDLLIPLTHMDGNRDNTVIIIPFL